MELEARAHELADAPPRENSECNRSDHTPFITHSFDTVAEEEEVEGREMAVAGGRL